MEKKSVLRAALVLAAAVSFGLTGCQTSSWNVHNPFERKPKPEIKSPAEMDDIQLKAPPERYTKDDYLRNAEQGERGEKSLAQTGEYGGKTGSAEYEHREPEKIAERNSSESSSSSDSSSTEPAPGFDDYPSSAPFAPGSIGESQLR